MIFSMKYKFTVYPEFAREFKRLYKKYPSLKKDLEAFREEYLANPTSIGVDLGNGIRKVRMSIGSKGKGKSHGARVITLTLILSEDETEIGLHYIYDKSEVSSITDKQIDDVLRWNGIDMKQDA